MTGMRLLGGLLAGALVCSGPLASSAWAVDVRPSGYMERGRLVSTDEGPAFLADLETGSHDGRYFRVGGYDTVVTYGVGNHPLLDWVWPSYHLKGTMRDMLIVSPNGLDRLVRYEEAQAGSEGLARFGAIITWIAVATGVGGFAYNTVPTNTREMQPAFWLGTGAAGAVGALLWGSSAWVAHENLTMLDDAIAAYNRDMAGRRRLNPRSTP